MQYIYEVARLNYIKSYKLIPETRLRELKSVGSENFFQILNEYKYKNVSMLVDRDDSLNFEKVLYAEIMDTVDLIESLLHKEHKWIIQWLRNFYVKKDFVSKEIENIKRKGQFLEIKRKLKAFKSIILDELYEIIIDFENIKIFLCYVNLNKFGEKITSMFFLDGGNIGSDIFKNAFPDIKKLIFSLKWTRYNGYKISRSEDTIENLYLFHKELIKLEIERSKVYYFTVEPIIAYFFEKYLEIQTVKEAYYNNLRRQNFSN